MSLPKEQHKTYRLYWQQFIWILKLSPLILHVLINEQAQILLSYAYCLGSLFSVSPLNPPLLPVSKRYQLSPEQLKNSIWTFMREDKFLISQVTGLCQMIIEQLRLKWTTGDLQSNLLLKAEQLYNQLSLFRTLFSDLETSTDKGSTTSLGNLLQCLIILRVQSCSGLPQTPHPMD